MIVDDYVRCIGCGEAKGSMAINPDEIVSNFPEGLCHACIRPLYKVKIPRNSVARLMIVALRYDEGNFAPGGD